MSKDNINFIPPKNDRMFKAIFTENINCLKEFVSSLADIPAKEMNNFRISNTEMPIKNKKGKISRLDMVVEVNNKIINIEIQLCKTKDFIERSLYYWARLYSEKLEVSMNYDSLPQTICINVLDYKMFENDNKYKHSAFISVDGTAEMLTDKLQIHFFELPKISKELEPNNDVKLWLQFLKVESRKELDMVKNSGNAAVSEAADVFMDKNSEWQKRIWKIQQDIAEMDERAALYYAREEGKAEGMAVGKAEGKAEGIEQNQKKWINKIKNSGLPKEEIDKLLS